LVLTAAAVLGRAESACPWLNAATAGGILGGPVTTSVKPGVCEFARGEAVLRIEVQKKPAVLSAKCESKATPLRAIGNEAVACNAGTAEMVIGRVRDERFLVSLRMVDASAGERVRKVAEQVAGSLF
jgi:hypothetical protein